MEINLPSYVVFVLDRLERNGFESYIVGGCVRDILLNKEPNDFDITTNALPEEIEEIFKDKKIIDIGKDYGTIKIIFDKQFDKQEVEVTTFRKEGSYLDGRRPERVEFVPTIEGDLSRRDFTINAMAYNREKGIVDPFNGMKDLNEKIVRCVGNPEDRFKEDYLRILRAIRFSAVLDFEIEEKTFEAGKKYGCYISKISMERINQEFFKILLSDTPSKGIRAMESMGILETILPEIVPAIGFDQKNPHHIRDVYNHILCVVDNSPPILKVRLAALFHDIGKPHAFSVDEKGVGHFYGHDKIGFKIAQKALDRMKAPKKLTEQVTILVKEHMTHHANFSDKGLKRLIRRVGEENIYELFKLQKADRMCSNEEASISHILEMEKRVDDILKKEEAYKVKQLAIDGKDLIELGFKEGKIIGEILEYLLEKVMEEPSINQKEKLKKLALKNYSIK